MALFDIEKLDVDFGGGAAVRGVSLTVERGEVLAIVGESGSGKSVAMLAAMGLIQAPGRVRAERLSFAGRDLRTLSPRARRALPGGAMAMIFQEPASSLNPCFNIGFQLMETLAAHGEGSRRARRARSAELLHQVGIPDAERRLSAYPHQLSGGMCQRVMIAMALACEPALLIADEPTTALDVTIQAQILALLLELQRERGMALVLITHDMGVVAECAQRVAVMYAGELVEQCPAAALFAQPRHPYSAALLAALPERAAGRRRLPALPGAVPSLSDRPPGCAFHPRCERFRAHCARQAPPLGTLSPAQRVRCHYPLLSAAAGGGEHA